MGVRRLAVANGPNIFQMLLVYVAIADHRRSVAKFLKSKVWEKVQREVLFVSTRNSAIDALCQSKSRQLMLANEE